MVPILLGRIQTRLFLLATVGVAVTALVTPVLPGVDSPYRTTFTILAAVGVLGVGWELVYHFLMQFRWEKDWPSLFGLLTAVPEGVVVWLVFRPPVDAFVLHFAAIWLAVWLVANGPMRVPFLRWRFRGGRLV
jgi:hypothetical protein